MKNLILTYERLGLILILLGGLGSQSTTSAARNTVVLPGLWCSQSEATTFSAAQRNTLQTKLRRITGWTQLSFAENGKLEIGDFAAIEGGARNARLTLLQALRSGKQFVIENHFASTFVNFGQLDEGTHYSDDRTGLALEIYRVRLDLADFDKMSASPAVRETFDEGFTLLHELLHGLGLRDTHIPNEIGECETAINKMRTELGLPLRDQYLADLVHVAPLTKIIRLRFRKQTLDQRGQARWKSQYLFFTPDFAFGQELTAVSSNAQAPAACLSLY